MRGIAYMKNQWLKKNSCEKNLSTHNISQTNEKNPTRNG